eukprot:gnl/MRDRNA2_/MRDRNA2_113967_c0_seq1.p1 gnl/MRDRNA2_/MRDRNA2_113967_c0~~gnl/MRDRNA2_/MRDRNA2_113967_c0_seq1.p1  ORF type:complete len:494 (+),score=76.98 gnl/MRDRNA2_/MRDRNA2_113967_c0_seq1:90-1484(+)
MTTTCIGVFLITHMISIAQGARIKSRHSELNGTQSDVHGSEGSLSLIVYNVEWKLTNAKFIKTNPNNYLNAMGYVTRENADFTLIPEATEELMKGLCDRRSSEHCLKDGSVCGNTKNDGSGDVCAYMFEQSYLEGFSMMWKPEKYTLKRRTCVNYAQTKKINVKKVKGDKKDKDQRKPKKESIDEIPPRDTHPNRDKIHKEGGWSALQNCVFLDEGEDFTHQYDFADTGYRTLLIAQFEERRTETNFIIVGCHPDHRHHDEDIVRLDKALKKFHAEIDKSDDHKPHFIIWAGDMNTHFKGIHASKTEQVDWVMENKTKKNGKPKFTRDEALQEVMKKTWILDPSDDKSVNHVLGDFLKKYKYHPFVDAASGPTPPGDSALAKWDEITCCCDLDTGDCAKNKYAFDHILYADSADAPVHREGTKVILGTPEKPHSDHIPLRLEFAWEYSDDFLAAIRAKKGASGD